MNFTGTFSFASRRDYRALYTISRGTCKTPTKPSIVKPIICTYAIENTKTGQAYVGSTENFFRRWKDHACSLKLGDAKNVLLQEAFNQYGIEAFTIRILEQYESTDGLLKAEAADALRFYSVKDLYNGRIGARIVAGYPFQLDARPKTKNPGRYTKARWYDGEKSL